MKRINNPAGIVFATLFSFPGKKEKEVNALDLLTVHRLSASIADDIYSRNTRLAGAFPFPAITQQ